MLRDVIIDGFRGFDHFEMRSLGRINLLVGTNNSGKTSLLEAIQLLSTGEPQFLWNILSRRGEGSAEDSARRSRLEVSICHLFNGHRIEVDSKFRLRGVNAREAWTLSATIVEKPDVQRELFEADEEYVGPFALRLDVEGAGSTRELLLPLSSKGGLSMDTLRLPTRQSGRSLDTQFVTTASMSPPTVMSLYEDIVLTPEEELVIHALKTVEPTVERIATTSKESPRPYHVYSGERGGILVKCKGTDQRIPIGSLGEGTWRMLGLAVALVRAENGILLVDEIDTGLHFSVMSKMWKLIYETARRLNVQVFATTHSRDAVDSLAAIARSDVSDDSQVTIQRIERDRGIAVAFSEQEIVVASERGIEVR